MSRGGFSLAELRAVLRDTTDRIVALFVKDARDGVVLNNAIFGLNIDMLEIFRNARAAVVVRDPRDQFADRRKKDLKHWMTPSRFVRSYRVSREAFANGRRCLQESLAAHVCEVQFERFVLDSAHRSCIVEWLAGSATDRQLRSRFIQERSAENVEIHRTLLTADERKVIEDELEQWCDAYRIESG
jgi:hypothetical protein